MLSGSLIYRVRGIDPDADKLIFGVREPGDKVIRVENFGRSEANIYLKIELDREVIDSGTTAVHTMLKYLFSLTIFILRDYFIDQR